MTPADAQKAIMAIEKQLSTLRLFAGMSAELPLKKGRGKNKGKAESPDGEPKKKRELTPLIAAMNEERKQIFEELKASWAEKNADFTSLDAKALSAAVKNGEVEAKPRFSDALKEHSKRQREGDPEKQAKYEAYRAKTDEKQAAKKSGASSVASASDSGSVHESGAVPATGEVKKERKNPWADLTEEQKAERVAKMTAGKVAKKAAAAAASAPVAVAPSVAAAVPASTASNAAAAPAVAEKRPVKVAPKPVAPVSAPAPAAAVEVVEASADDEEAFQPFEFKGTKYWKNGLQYVYKKTSDGGFGDYVGRYDVPKRKIDTTVPEPPVED
jgi:hypothetical protein